ncbi:MAG TPA: ATP-binding protein [Chloroflexota bacterium]|nr:ATP-binding protein [Chloroflexota bacterium]
MKPTHSPDDHESVLSDVSHPPTPLEPATEARAQGTESPRQSEESFELLVDSIKDYAILILDREGYIRSWNEGARRVKGYTESEIVGKHFSIFYTPEDLANGEPRHLLDLAAREGRVEREAWRVRKDGTRFWADVVITALRDKEGRLVGYGKVTRDLTERQRATEERIRLAGEREARLAAEESVRMRDEFLGVAAHELKTPVTSLLLQTQLLARRLRKDGTLEPASVSRALVLVEEQSQKLAELVSKLLDVSRIANGRLALDCQAIDVARLVAGVVGRIGLLSPDRRFTLSAPEALVAVVDPLRLEQVVTNLLDNAVKYSSDGPIEITVSQPDDAHLRIAVRDYGPGVPDAERENLFARFYQVATRGHHGGMGLGLYVSKQIAQLHGGDLTAEFPPEGGSQFVVTLPREPNLAT